MSAAEVASGSGDDVVHRRRQEYQATAAADAIHSASSAMPAPSRRDEDGDPPPDVAATADASSLEYTRSMERAAVTLVVTFTTASHAVYSGPIIAMYADVLPNTAPTRHSSLHSGVAADAAGVHHQ